MVAVVLLYQTLGVLESRAAQGRQNRFHLVTSDVATIVLVKGPERLLEVAQMVSDSELIGSARTTAFARLLLVQSRL